MSLRSRAGLRRSRSNGESGVAEDAKHGFVADMQVQDIKEIVERAPFRPFTVRLNNGAEYHVRQPRDVGAPQNYRLLIYFGEGQTVRIDTDSIAKVIED